MTPLTQQLEDKKKDELRERLAELEHKQWSHWTKYMLDELYGLFDLDTLNRNCKPVQSLRRWQKQMKTEYKDLTEKEKDSDREWADKVLEQAIAEIKSKDDKIFELECKYKRAMEGWVDNANLLQKQRQEILDILKKVIDNEIILRQSLKPQRNKHIDKMGNNIFEKFKQQLNQPKTEE